MPKKFNVTGNCNGQMHYMVNLDSRIKEIKQYVDDGDYFTINRGRQYGKTTTLDHLAKALGQQYTVFYISFEGMTDAEYQGESAFCRMFAGLLYDVIDYGEVDGIDQTVTDSLEKMSSKGEESVTFRDLSNLISTLCRTCNKPVVLMIDEVDQASKLVSFPAFLGMLRDKYLKRGRRPTFQSVILAGVYDIRNLKQKIRSEEDHQKNSPWNIAAKFEVDMSFSQSDIVGMLAEYEQDHGTGMDIDEMARLIYEYTSGYPFLVSAICKILDEIIWKNEKFGNRRVAWTREGLLSAVKILLQEKNTLFESLINRLIEYPELKEALHSILFIGGKITFNIDNDVIDIASMFGFVKREQGNLVIANRIFETRLYNYFLSEEEISSRLYKEGTAEKNRFIQNGTIDMELLLQRFMIHWNDLYHSADEKFIEENGRKFFLLYLKPIINGVGNYYIESRTRDNGRTDVIVDYLGKQYIIEIKIWRGNEYNKRGEVQLAEYLDAYHAKKGYMISFNFNKKKVTGMKEIICGDKVIVEVVV